MEAQGSAVYDPSLDRFDVAVRAVVAACTRPLHRQREIQQALGITPAHREAIIVASLELEAPLRTEAGVFEMLRACPCVLDYALPLLIGYQTVSIRSRDYHYARGGQ